MEQRVVQPVDYMKLLYDSPDVSIYELDAIHLDVNSNQMSIDEDCVKHPSQVLQISRYTV